jgi:hypothetical protein
MRDDISGACLVGCYCSHAVLTVKIGVYRCPFGACVKREVLRDKEGVAFG